MEGWNLYGRSALAYSSAREAKVEQKGCLGPRVTLYLQTHTMFWDWESTTPKLGTLKTGYAMSLRVACMLTCFRVHVWAPQFTAGAMSIGPS